MATTLLRSAGTSGNGRPHITTVPLRRKASEWFAPAATATTSCNPSGTSAPPKLTTVPGVGKVNVCSTTVNEAASLKTAPKSLLTATAYWPAAVICTVLNSRRDVVAQIG